MRKQHGDPQNGYHCLSHYGGLLLLESGGRYCDACTPDVVLQPGSFVHRFPGWPHETWVGPENQRKPLPELAALLGMSYSGLRRAMKAQAGISPLEAVLEARIRHAHHLLADRSLTVTEIAAALGYPDVFTFSKQFHQRTGIAPREYRERMYL